MLGVTSSSLLLPLFISSIPFESPHNLWLQISYLSQFWLFYLKVRLFFFCRYIYCTFLLLKLPQRVEDD